MSRSPPSVAVSWPRPPPASSPKSCAVLPSPAHRCPGRIRRETSCPERSSRTHRFPGLSWPGPLISRALRGCTDFPVAVPRHDSPGRGHSTLVLGTVVGRGPPERTDLPVAAAPAEVPGPRPRPRPPTASRRSGPPERTDLPVAVTRLAAATPALHATTDRARGLHPSSEEPQASRDAAWRAARHGASFRRRPTGQSSPLGDPAAAGPVWPASPPPLEEIVRH
jgi:hypothetical protein